MPVVQIGIYPDRHLSRSAFIKNCAIPHIAVVQMGIYTKVVQFLAFWLSRSAFIKSCAIPHIPVVQMGTDKNVIKYVTFVNLIPGEILIRNWMLICHPLLIHDEIVIICRKIWMHRKLLANAKFYTLPKSEKMSRSIISFAIEIFIPALFDFIVLINYWIYPSKQSQITITRPESRLKSEVLAVYSNRLCFFLTLILKFSKICFFAKFFSRKR